jgi:tetratricopeptide (TPR) repeat protein
MTDFDLRWAYTHPAQEEERLKQMLPVAEAAGDSLYTLGLMTQIARAQGMQQRFDEAHATLDLVESRLTPELATARVRYLLERGRLFTLGRQRAKGRPLFEAAVELAVSTGAGYHAVDAAHMVAIASSDPAEQLAWNLRALTLTEEFAEAEIWFGALYFNLGMTYARMRRHADALAMFQRSQALYAARPWPERERLARTHAAKMLRLLDRPAQALREQQMLAATGEEDGVTQEEIGECLMALGCAERSWPHFDRAYRALSQNPWVVRDEPGRLERLKSLGRQ